MKDFPDIVFWQVLSKYSADMPAHCKRLQYIFDAQMRFYKMMEVSSC